MKSVTINLLCLFLLCQGLVMGQNIPNTLSPEQKAYELSLIWKEMSYNFDNMNHCPELDIDSLYRAFIPIVMSTPDDYAYSKEIMRFLAHFRNNHTYVADSPSWITPLAQLYIRTEYRDGKLFLTNFYSKYMDRMHVGDEIVSINRQNAVDYMRENMLPYVPATNDEHRWKTAMSFNGPWTFCPYGTLFELTMKGDTTYRLLLPAEKRIEDERNDWFVNDYEMNKENLLYVDSDSQTAYLRIIDCLVSGKNFFLQCRDSISSCKQIILDLTHNTGGQSYNTEDVAGFLAKVDTFSSETILSRMNVASMKAQGMNWCNKESENEDILCLMKNGTYFTTFPSAKYANPYYPNCYQGQVVVITGSGTASAAEWLVSRLKQDKSIVFYGETTSGATGYPYQLALPSGLVVRFNTWRTFSPDGMKETSYGFVPTIPLDFSDCYKSTRPTELFYNIMTKIKSIPHAGEFR